MIKDTDFGDELSRQTFLLLYEFYKSGDFRKRLEAFLLTHEHAAYKVQCATADFLNRVNDKKQMRIVLAPGGAKPAFAWNK